MLDVASIVRMLILSLHLMYRVWLYLDYFLVFATLLKIIVV